MSLIAPDPELNVAFSSPVWSLVTFCEAFLKLRDEYDVLIQSFRPVPDAGMSKVEEELRATIRHYENLDERRLRLATPLELEDAVVPLAAALESQLFAYRSALAAIQKERWEELPTFGEALRQAESEFRKASRLFVALCAALQGHTPSA